MERKYVSYQLAKLLKKNGFDWYCEGVYYFNSNGKMCYFKEEEQKNSKEKELIPAPTYEQVLLWMSCMKHINIIVGPLKAEAWNKLWTFDFTKFNIIKGKYKVEFSAEGCIRTGGYQTKYDALEEGVKEALTHLNY